MDPKIEELFLDSRYSVKPTYNMGVIKKKLGKMEVWFCALKTALMLIHMFISFCAMLMLFQQSTNKSSLPQIPPTLLFCAWEAPWVNHERWRWEGDGQFYYARILTSHRTGATVLWIDRDPSHRLVSWEHLVTPAGGAVSFWYFLVLQRHTTPW